MSEATQFYAGIHTIDPRIRVLRAGLSTVNFILPL